MKLKDNFRKFEKGETSKAQFIQNNFEGFYAPIFEVADYLNLTDISKVELTDGQVVMTYRRTGMKLTCERNEYRTAPLETLNFLQYEEAEVSVFNKLLKGKKSFYDIGGNIGFYAINAVILNPEIIVNTFEPIPKMFSTLQKNVELNSSKDRIKAHNLGFSDSEQTVSFFIYPFGGTNASMVNVSDSHDAQEVKAHVLRLDDFVMRGNTPPDIIKCDVEGAEKLVLLGGLETVKKYHPILFFELLRKWSAKFNYHPNDVLDILKEHGYQCFVPHEGKLKKFESIDENTLETNFFFLHSTTHSKSIQELSL